MKDLIIYHTPDGRSSLVLYAKDGNVWLNQVSYANGGQKKVMMRRSAARNASTSSSVL